MSDGSKPRGRSDREIPILTDVAIPGDAARQRGIYLEAKQPVPADNATPDAEEYLAERLKNAVREALSEAMVRAARSVGRGQRPRPGSDNDGR